ncbi:MAG: nucleoside hydrolase-like domain-containing protein [Chitinophagaceae bacterium]
MKVLTILFFSILSICLSQKGFSQTYTKNRVIILSDIEADPDDAESFVRLFLYANQIDIKGMIATTSCWQKNRVAPASIKKIIKAYGSVQPNLNKNELGFPAANTLLLTVKQGLAKYGMLGVGADQDSEGSDWIIKILEDNDPRPLYISVWGGANTLAQALYKLKETKNATEIRRLISKLRVYTISDQDDSGLWMRNTFPDLYYIVSPGDDYGSATWSAINSQIKGISNEEISNKWLAQNIQQGHGPLGAAYPDVAWGMEGDTPSWLYLIPNGLNNPENPNWGGWGGRYELYKPDFANQKTVNSGVPLEPETRAIWTNASDNYNHFISNNFGRVVTSDTTRYNDNKASLWRWREDFQNDFAARMDWCMSAYKNANHPPVPVLKQKDEITVKSGQGFGIDASDTYDPDGDSFSYLWFDYPEAGTYKKPIKISSENYNNIWITAPDVEKKETVHIILKITDKGTPQLSRYKRIIVTILPK